MVLPFSALSYSRRHLVHLWLQAVIHFGRLRRRLHRFYWANYWRLRWEGIRLGRWAATGTSVDSRQISGGDIGSQVAVVYINLDRRPDRNSEILSEFSALGIDNPIRFSAFDGQKLSLIDAPVGSLPSLGCAMSHTGVLEQVDSEERAIMVCEDDLEFIAAADEVFRIITEFLRDPRLDVLCLGSNVSDKPISVSKDLSISQSLSTTSCYVVKNPSVQLLRESFAESVQMFLEGKKVEVASIDQHWKKLQRTKLIFAFPTKRIARQRRSISDITGGLEDRGV